MIIKASLVGLKIKEIPINIRKSNKNRESHLRTWRDGWRHLKYMLSFAPNFNLLPFSIFFFILGITLIGFYLKKFTFFSGPNTLLISISLFILSFNIASDYMLSKEIIFNKYKSKRERNHNKLIKLLGLKKGTDRIFKLALSSFILSIIFGLRFFINFLNDSLSTKDGIINGYLFSITAVICISAYLTATKLNTFRSLYLNHKKK